MILETSVFIVLVVEKHKKCRERSKKRWILWRYYRHFFVSSTWKSKLSFASGMLACISVLMGLVAAIWVVNYSLNYTEKLFIKENALKLSVNECWQLYRDGKKFRIKFFWIKMLFFIFECIYLAALLKTSSKILFWINVLLCFVLFICIYIERPICKICFKRRMRRRNE